MHCLEAMVPFYKNEINVVTLIDCSVWNGTAFCYWWTYHCHKQKHEHKYKKVNVIHPVFSY